MEPRRHRSRLVSTTAVVAMLAVAAIGAVGCSEEPPAEFTDDNRSGFLAACTRPLDDIRLTSAICQCIIDQSLREIPFDRFSAIEDDLVLDPTAPLPDELAEIVARCVIEEASL